MYSVLAVYIHLLPSLSPISSSDPRSRRSFGKSELFSIVYPLEVFSFLIESYLGEFENAQFTTTSHLYPSLYLL